MRLHVGEENVWLCLRTLTFAKCVSNFYKAFLVKSAQVWACASCLLLLNTLRAIVHENILVHMSCNCLRFWLTLFTEPLRPILDCFLCLIGKTVITWNKHAICVAVINVMYVLNLAFPAGSAIKKHI